jgi:L-lactate dehydrogenase complex protein LldG
VERDAFLERVRTATATARLPRPDTPRPAIPDVDDDSKSMFTAALLAVNGNVHSPPTQAEVPELVVGLLTDSGSQRVLAWDDDQLPLPGVIDTVRNAGFEFVTPDVPSDPVGRINHQAGYGTVDAGITGAAAGFARSGSVVLTAGSGRPRMASLIPSLHVALLPSDALYPSASAWAADNVASAQGTSNLVFITGPSRTGDIEMHLNLGVHGPRTIHVVLVPVG